MRSTERLRTLAAPLRYTFLHPQWFCFRLERRWLGDVAARCRGRVLDIGCGRQRVREFLPADCDYLGVDYPATATTLYAIRPDVFADGARLPFTDASVDTVLLLEVLEHVADPRSALDEARRVLRPGGTLLLSVPFLYPVHDAPHDFSRWTPFGLRAALCSAGFELERLEPDGTPLRTGALLLNLALARTALDLLRRRHPLALLALPVCATLVPLLNLAAWAFGRSREAEQFMPFGLRIVACAGPTPALAVPCAGAQPAAGNGAMLPHPCADPARSDRAP